jgi:hypothetical protein
MFKQCIVTLALLGSSAACLAGGSGPPVRVNCDHSLSSATVRVRFLQPAHNVELSANGLDGLTLRKAAGLHRDRVQAGEEVTFAVEYTVGQGAAGLNVNVGGSFGRRYQSGAYAFIVRPPAPKKLSTDPVGQKVLVIPSP